MSETRPRLIPLVLVPGLLTLAVTLLRLTGELRHWSPVFFNAEGGGGGALVGISWLPPVFGVWFALKLARAGERPGRTGRAIGFALGSLLLLPLAAAASQLLKLSLGTTIVFFGVVLLAAAWVASRGWPALGRTLLAYALAARVPVAIIMLFAILGSWGTHYDAPPPGLPPMGPFTKWVLVGLVPQLTMWVGFTVVTGMITGTITAALSRGKGGSAVADAA